MTKKLQLFVCENFYSEYLYALQTQKFENDVDLRTFPSLCEHKGRKAEVKDILSHFQNQEDIIICSRSCGALDLLSDISSVRAILGNYCFSQIVCNEFLDYLTAQGSYIVGADWLKNWETHIDNMGFDKDTARQFFRASSKQLVYLGLKGEDAVEESMEDLSSYVGLPFFIIPVELEEMKLLVKSIVFEWRLHHQADENAATMQELRSQNAEYFAVFDMLGKISTYTKKRDVIEKIKEIFLMIFGAQDFKFWTDFSDSTPKDVSDFRLNKDKTSLMYKESNRFLIKILWNDTFYGIIDASGFLFPKHIEKYLNLALEITKLAGLVLYNSEQYEKILHSEKEMTYISLHDSMTGLHNRAYVNRLSSEISGKRNIVVYMFDIDKLKYVNDHYGHVEGDKLIISFADAMKKTFRETDVIARIGGDEFLAVLFDADKKIAESTAQRINAMIELNNKNLEEEYLFLSVSLGYAISEDENETIESLMIRADERMYAEKAQRKAQSRQ